MNNLSAFPKQQQSDADQVEATDSIDAGDYDPHVFWIVAMVAVTVVLLLEFISRH